MNNTSLVTPLTEAPVVRGEMPACRQGAGGKNTAHQDLMRSSFLFLIKNITFKMPHSFFVFIDSKHRNFS